jgi:prolyl 4-hydroxylase
VSEIAQGVGDEAWASLSDYVVEAANHDASHQHDDAINSLARGARAGDVESTTRLGKRLLVGDSAPYLPLQGARFLIDAAKAGGAEAPAILAVLSAAGAHVRQSWHEGLSALVLAAERGWLPAREQLGVLAVDRDLAAAAPALAPSDSKVWKRLGQSVAAGPWHVAPERRELNKDPAIVSFPGLLSPAICEWFVEQARPRLEPARVDETRTHSAARFSLVDATFVHLLMQARMAASCGIPIQQMGTSTVLHYRPGQESANHHESVDHTFLAYLNDDYEGGETHFPELTVRHEGTRGEGLYFVSVKHAGLPPTQGDKWMVSQSIRNRTSVD